jgi:hypothetical protein
VGWGILLLAVLSVGCVTTSGWLHNSDPPKPGVACQVVCTWQNSVAFVPDPAQGGNAGPGFVGRVYLFGQTMDHPVLAEGTISVDLIEETGSAPVWLERWNLDADTVKRLVKKDMIGWGYTVFLPSKTARPDMSKIRLRTAFTAPNSAPIYAENIVTLSQTNGVIRESTKPLSMPGTNPPTSTKPQGSTGVPPRSSTLPPPIPVR